MPRRVELRDQLALLEPADARERAHKQRLLTLLADASDPFDRAQYVPGHVTASAFVVDAACEQVLLILHGKLRRWLQPGGHVEPEDSDVLAAARREVWEETGVEPCAGFAARGGEGTLLDVDVHLIPERAGTPGHEHFDVRFLFRSTGGQARAGSDARQVCWVPIDRLLAGQSPPSNPTDWPSDESVLRALRKLRARFA